MGFLPPHSNHWDDGTPEYHNNISCSCRKKFTPSSKLLMTKGPWNPRIWIWLCKFWRIMTLIVSFSTNYNSKSHYYIRLMTCVQWPMTDLHTVIVRGGELAHWWFNGLLMGGFCVQSLPGCISKGLCLIVASIIFTSLLYCWCGNDVKLCNPFPCVLPIFPSQCNLWIINGCIYPYLNVLCQSKLINSFVITWCITWFITCHVRMWLETERHLWPCKVYHFWPMSPVLLMSWLCVFLIW